MCICSLNFLPHSVPVHIPSPPGPTFHFPFYFHEARRCRPSLHLTGTQHRRAMRSQRPVGVNKMQPLDKARICVKTTNRRR